MRYSVSTQSDPFQSEKERKASLPPSRTFLLLEWVMLLSMLLTLPMAVMVMELMFHYGTRNIPDDILEKMWKEDSTS